MQPSDVALLATWLTEAGRVLASNCQCGRSDCTTGEHLLRATRDATPGIPASPLEPSRGSGGGIVLDERPARPEAHDRLCELTRRMIGDARWLLNCVDSWAPDRARDDTADPSQWCKHHLQALGTCEPLGSSGRDGYCSWCYSFRRTHQALPPVELLEHRHRGGTVTARMVSEALADERAARKRQKKGKGKRKGRK